MELTTRGRYAVMAMADIARHTGASAQPLSQISERQRLPLPYLEQIFLNLRRAGLVESARGRTGGYRLARSADAISVLEVLRAVEEDTVFTRCSSDAEGCVAGTRCITHGLWQGLSAVATDFLKSTSLASVIAGKPELNLPRGRVYLDHNASAPLRKEARAALIGALEISGNASSVHAEGRAARACVETAREQVAGLINSKPSEVVFTSGATEANAFVFVQAWDTILVSAIEHDSVLAPARASRARVIEFGANADGVVRVEDIARHVLCGPPLGRTLIALQWANNESGVLQPISDVAAFAREHGLFLHVDAVQVAGRVPIDFANEPGIATLALSSHKIGGPKGAGALIIRDRLDLTPLIRGGGQERRRRGGTENIASIAGFGAAADHALRTIADFERIAMLRNRLETGVMALTPKAVVIGKDSPRLANSSAIALPGKLAEILVIKLDLAGIAVSAGAACSSGKVGASHVLNAMGLAPEIARGAIRVSLGLETTDDDVAAFLAAWEGIAAEPALAA